MGKELKTLCRSGERLVRRQYSPPTAEAIGVVSDTVLGGSPGGGDSTGSRTQQPFPGDGGRPLPPPTR